jgi:hypothetical protein
MKPEPQETACQGRGVSDACLVRAPRSPGGMLRALSTPATRATPWRAGLPGPVAGAMAWQ